MELVSASEAARRLGVDPSQITRGIQSGLIRDHAPPGLGRPIVDVVQAREARQSGLDRSKQRGIRSPLFAPDTPPPAAATPAPEPPETVAAAPVAPAARDAAPEEEGRDPSYQASRARRETAAAEKAEIELAQLRGRTLARAEVMDVALRLGQMPRDALEARRIGLAQRLAGLDVPAMIGVLTDADEALLAALADAIERELVPEEAGVAV